MELVLDSPALHSYKNLISSQATLGYFLISFNFWLLEMEFAIAYYFQGSFQELAFPSVAAFQAFSEAAYEGLSITVRAMKVSQLLSVAPRGGILTIFQFSPREILVILYCSRAIYWLGLGTVCHILLFEWCLMTGLSRKF